MYTTVVLIVIAALYLTIIAVAVNIITDAGHNPF